MPMCFSNGTRVVPDGQVFPRSQPLYQYFTFMAWNVLTAIEECLLHSNGGPVKPCMPVTPPHTSAGSTQLKLSIQMVVLLVCWRRIWTESSTIFLFFLQKCFTCQLVTVSEYMAVGDQIKDSL